MCFQASASGRHDHSKLSCVVRSGSSLVALGDAAFPRLVRCLKDKHSALCLYLRTKRLFWISSDSEAFAEPNQDFQPLGKNKTRLPYSFSREPRKTKIQKKEELKFKQ